MRTHKHTAVYVRVSTAGQAAAKANGKRWGGSKSGRYLKVGTEQVKAITAMKRAGKPISTIAKITGLSRPTVYRVLRNERDS